MNAKFTDKLQFAITFSFQILIFLTPFIWTSITSELFELPKMTFVYLMTIFILTLWLLRMVNHSRIIFTRSPLDIPIAIFLASQILSTFFSLDPHTSIFGYYSRFHGGLLSTFSYITLFYVFISNVPNNQFKNSLTTLLTSATLASLYAFPEHFGHSPSCAMITGNFNATCWVQDVQNRIFGTFGQPNWLAAYLITLIFIPIGLLLHSLHNTKLKLTIGHTAYAAITILFFLTLLFTKSRSGLLGLAIGSVVFVTLLLTQSKLPRQKIIKQLTLLLACAGLLFLFFGRNVIPQLNPYLPQFSPAKIQNPSSNIQIGTSLETGGTSSGEIRRIVWKGALDLWQKYPLFGSGVETFAYGYYQVRPIEHNLVSEWDFLYNKAHNEFLNILATTGIIGFLAYLLLIGSILITSIKKISTNTQSRYLLPAFIGGFTALMVSNFFGFSTVPVGLLFVLLPALTLILTRKESSLNFSPALLGPRRYILIALILLTSIYLLHHAISIFTADVYFAQAKNAMGSSDVTTSIIKLDQALRLFGSESNYTEQLALATAQAALISFQSGDATTAAQLAEQAQLISNLNISQNPFHLNFHKSRARVFMYLSQLDPEFLNLAIEALEIAQTLAPTDPKLTFNLALLHQQLGENNKAIDYYLKAISMKPDYADPRDNLARLLTQLGRFQEAIDQYQFMVDHFTPVNPKYLQEINNLTQRIATQSSTINQ